VSAGILPPPGTFLIKNLFLFQAESAHVISADGRIEAHTHSMIYNDAVFLAYVSRLSILGARWAIGTIQMVRIATQSARIGPRGTHVPEQQMTIGGLGDGIFIPALLGWNFNQFHLTAAFAFYAPTGSYSPNRIISTGLNRWAFEPDVGFTWLSPSGHELSVMAGYTMNTTNTADDYHSGDEFHADFAAVQHTHHDFLYGVAGYAFQQTTADTGSGALLGPFRGRVIGLGPMLGYTIPLEERLPLGLTVKYELEFADQNRASGDALWFNAALLL
jgi:hypothetical protein